ncbi:hypothetical protein Brsp02_04164 [Brucella sp. NBRC 113783]
MFAGNSNVTLLNSLSLFVVSETKKTAPGSAAFVISDQRNDQSFDSFCANARKTCSASSSAARLRASRSARRFANS